MKTRVITAIIALSLFVPILIISGLPLIILMSILGVIGISEFLYMKKRSLVSWESILASLLTIYLILPRNIVHPLVNYFPTTSVIYFVGIIFLLLTVFSKSKFSFDSAGALLLGSLYIGVGFHYFLQVRNVNPYLFVYGLIVVWLTDSFAYIIGKKIGKNKLIPKVSPNKTWEGSLGGSLVAVIFGIIYLLIFKQYTGDDNIFIKILFTIILSTSGQIGDLIESAFKRFYDVKDSGKILPGHGGILDRFDSLLIVMPLIALLFGVHA
jgi:phosphatidate cytidylyltransferase